VDNLYQKTIAKIINFEGVGLHSGLVSKVRLLPAPENYGIVFTRVDLKQNNKIEANFKNVSSAKLCTTLTNATGTAVSTVEHLMAAFYISGIDNIEVEIDSSEVPIMDGSSKDFIELISKSGLKTQNLKRKFLKILKKVEYNENDKSISIEENQKGLEVDFQLVYKNQIIGNQKNNVNFYNCNLKEIYSSRTFCLFEDIEKIKKNGLAKGGSLSNAVVVKDEEILNDEGLRNKKEFVNHKILDLAGDFMLSGYRILGSVKCVQGGHLLSNRFIRKIFEDSSNYELSSLNNIEIIKNNFKNPINKLAVNA
jgi:UDP-3-O-[3-hydroxymyristoyl] N-acetylglucosamine deacetylase|tara:strand:+ start:688 stop:1614 length:927 start_codon:yes stop_codon:yes gene_type:complete